MLLDDPDPWAYSDREPYAHGQANPNFDPRPDSSSHDFVRDTDAHITA